MKSGRKLLTAPSPRLDCSHARRAPLPRGRVDAEGEEQGSSSTTRRVRCRLLRLDTEPVWLTMPGGDVRARHFAARTEIVNPGDGSFTPSSPRNAGTSMSEFPLGDRDDVFLLPFRAAVRSSRRPGPELSCSSREYVRCRRA